MTYEEPTTYPPDCCHMCGFHLPEHRMIGGLCFPCRGDSHLLRPWEPSRRWCVFTDRHGEVLAKVPIPFASETSARRYVERFGGRLVPPEEVA